MEVSLQAAAKLKPASLQQHRRSDTTKWNALSSKLHKDSLATALQSAVHQSTLARVVDVFGKVPEERTTGDYKFVKHYLEQRVNQWEFLKKRRQLIPQMCRRLTILSVAKGENVYNVDDNAKAMFIVLHGGVAVYAQSDVDDDEYFHPATRTTEELKSVQRALDAVKTFAAVEPAKALAPVVKADVTATPIESDSEEEEVQSFNVRKTWGKAIHRAKMAIMLNDSIDELKRGLVKKQSHTDGMSKVHQARAGNSFGEVGLSARLPMRSTRATATRDSYLLVMSRDDYVRMKEREGLSGDKDANVDLLRGLHWLRPLGVDVVHRLAYHCRSVSLPAGSIIVKEGEITKLMYIIRRGEVDVVLRSHVVEDSGEVAAASKYNVPYHLGILSRGECFGEKPLLVAMPNDFAFVARTECELLAIGGKAFAAIKKRVFVPLMDSLSAKLHFRARRLAEVIATQTRVKRMERALLPETPLFTKSEAELRLQRPMHSSRPLRISALSPTPAPSTQVAPTPGDTWQSPTAMAGSPQKCSTMAWQSPTAASSPATDVLSPLRRTAAASMRRTLLSRSASSGSLSLRRPADGTYEAFMSPPAGDAPSLEKPTLAPSPSIGRAPSPSSGGTSPPPADTGRRYAPPSLVSPIRMSTRPMTTPARQVQPLEGTVAPMTHTPTGALPGSPSTHLRASVHRDLSSPLSPVYSPGGTVVKGFVGAGRSPPPQRKSRPMGGRKAVEAMDKTAGTTRKPFSPDMIGDLQAPPMMRKTKTMLASTRGQPVDSREWGPKHTAEYERRLEKLAAMPLKRRALVAMGVQRR